MLHRPAPASTRLRALTHDAIDAYEACPQKFFDRYISPPDDAYARPPAHARAGLALRAAISHLACCPLEERCDTEVAVRAMEHYWREFVSYSDFRGGRYHDELDLAHAAMAWWLKCFAFTEADPHRIESFFRVPLPNGPQITGIIDRIDQVPGAGALRITLLDTTDEGPRTPGSPATREQLVLYAAQFGGREVESVRTVYLRARSIERWAPTHADLERIEERLVSTSDAILASGYFAPLPSVFNCAACVVRPTCRAARGQSPTSSDALRPTPEHRVDVPAQYEFDFGTDDLRTWAWADEDSDDEAERGTAWAEERERERMARHEEDYEPPADDEDEG